ncbi:NBS-LRR type resistance protein [Cucumis melo var. makuwa]|uniref:NBS-LRR type resistance protein n=1 Tax=Cucumis melo var. makuwa TaxID=1194695 RepID=A0A5D3DLI7_CUCMM|nr:NBS-LRR type resistance protein [Cucumis melo var. makuwa]TYK24139.1 NBS-LRR type resistance protein [Cucumis melo var. makuwa]
MKRSSDLVEYAYQFSDPVGYTSQSSDLEGYTYQSSDPIRYTSQSSDPEGCTTCGDPVGHRACKVHYPIDKANSTPQSILNSP